MNGHTIDARAGHFDGKARIGAQAGLLTKEEMEELTKITAVPVEEKSEEKFTIMPAPIE